MSHQVAISVDVLLNGLAGGCEGMFFCDENSISLDLRMCPSGPNELTPAATATGVNSV
jgi:hypothetical protein